MLLYAQSISEYNRLFIRTSFIKLQLHKVMSDVVNVRKLKITK